MRLTTLAVAALGLALALPATADYTPYSQLRQDHASIDAAVAPMSNSDIHGTFNRISALFTRRQVRDLIAGDGNEGLLPRNFDASMVAALADLQLDLKDELQNLTLEERYTILQVVEVTASSRNVELFQGWDDDDGTCIPTPENPCPPPIAPDVIAQLDRLLRSFRAQVIAMIDDYNAETGSSLLRPGDAGAREYVPASFDAWMDDVRGSFGVLHGVESIDD